MPRAGLSAARLAQTGAEVADELGLAAVTPTELARRHDVRVASLYAHVSGAHELRVGVTRLALAELLERTEAAVGDSTGVEGLRSLGDALRDYAREHPGRWEATRVPLTPHEAEATVGRDHADLIRRVLAPYGLGAEQQVDAARIVGATWTGFVDLEAGGAFDHSDPPPEQTWSRVAASLDVMLRDWAARR